MGACGITQERWDVMTSDEQYRLYCATYREFTLYRSAVMEKQLYEHFD